MALSAVLWLVTGWLALIACGVGAQASERPIRIVLGFAGGTSPDVALRIVAEKLSVKLGQPIIVENLTGAAGNLAAHRVAMAEPDGQTLLYTSASSLVSAAIMPSTLVDMLTAFRPITLLFEHPNVLLVNKTVGARSVQDLIAFARSHPGTLAFASAGTGTTQHLAVEMLRAMAKIDITHVPYRGGSNILQDLLSNQVGATFGVPSNLMPFVDSGDLVALAVSSGKRFRLLADLSTLSEAGLPGFEMTVWWGLFAPAATPTEIVEKLNRAVFETLAEPEIRKRLDAIYMDVRTSTPAEFAELIAVEAPKWAQVVRSLGLKPN